MKCINIARLVFSMAAFDIATASALESETVDGITWEYWVNEGRVEIHKAYNAAGKSVPLSGALSIPSALGGYPVIHIGTFAFSGCSRRL